VCDSVLVRNRCRVQDREAVGSLMCATAYDGSTVRVRVRVRVSSLSAQNLRALDGRVAKSVGYSPISAVRRRLYVPIHGFFCPPLGARSLVEACTFACTSSFPVGTRPRRAAFERLARGTISPRARRARLCAYRERGACLSSSCALGSVLVSRASAEDNRSHHPGKHAE
jgi:hypothetical protein